jgi:hypothetical protein
VSIADEFATENRLVLSGTVNGKPKTLELVLGRATLTVQGNFSAWCRDVTMERCRQLAAQLPESGRRVAIERACDMVVKECGWGQPVANSIMSEPIGMGKYLHLLLDDEQRKNVSVLDITDLVWAADGDEINRKLLSCNGISQADIDRAVPQKKTPDPTPSTGEPSSPISPGG